MAKYRDGTVINTNGYPRISAGPLRNVYVHTLVAEAKIGRKLTADEVVDHIDGNKLNCAPENLRVIPRPANTEYYGGQRKAEREQAAAASGV